MTVIALFQSHCFLEMLELNHVNKQRVDKFDFEDECDCEVAFALNHDTVFEFVEPGTYVCMRSPTNDIESFFCC